MLDEGAYIFDGDAGDRDDDDLDPELVALRLICAQARRQQFQFVTSPLSIAEVANIQNAAQRHRRLSWFLEMLAYWTAEIEYGDLAKSSGGDVRHRFKLSEELQVFESRLLSIPDFRRDPFDRLLLIHCKMANCDAFLTNDRNTIWRHREMLAPMGIVVVVPTEYQMMIAPYAAL
jgi:hypothetical protein